MTERRTQEERSAAMIRRLLDAAIETLIEVGYGEASVQRVCEHAGVSQGALFRHFPTREALMVAVGRDVASRTLNAYRKDFKRLHGKEQPHALALRLVRTHCRSRLNLAWYELSLAARTRPALRAELSPVLVSYHADITALARELLPELASALGERFEAAVSLIVAVFDGESVERFVAARPKMDNGRMDILMMLMQLVPMLSGAPAARQPVR